MLSRSWRPKTFPNTLCKFQAASSGWAAVLKTKKTTVLHSPYFEIDEAALLHGVAILYQTALLALKQPETAAKEPVFS